MVIKYFLCVIFCAQNTITCFSAEFIEHYHVMTTIGSIGIGLLILIIIWILALVIFVIGVKIQSNIAWIALGSAAIVTFCLVSIPVEKHIKQLNSESEEKDYTQIFRNLFLTFLVFSAIIGCISLFLFHCIEPIRAKPIKGF